LTSTLGVEGKDIIVAVRAQIYTDCWGSDINAGCGGRDITVAVGAQIYTLIVGAVT
jgi:hypothetical protein